MINENNLNGDICYAQTNKTQIPPLYYSINTEFVLQILFGY